MIECCARRLPIQRPPLYLSAFVIAGLVALGGCSGDDADPFEDEEIPTEPRQSDELPGADGQPGVDPCDDEPDCSWTARGEGAEVPLEPVDDSDAVSDEGGVTLDDEPTETHVGWIPNTGGDTVSRIDLEQRLEVARYRSGPTAETLEPAHTSVRRDGGVYVANRAGRTVVSIELDPECPVVEGEGEPTTSTGSDDVLAWGDDYCVVWSSELPDHGDLTGVAGQQIDGDPYVWVAGADGRIWRLDGESGDPLFFTDSPVDPRGLAVDEEAGDLWIAGEDATLGRIDTDECVDHDSCETEICGDDGDDCIKQVVDVPEPFHALTFDGDGGLLLAGGDLLNYDPAAAPGHRWTATELDDFVSLRGIARDDEWIYAAAGQDGVIRFDAEDPDNYTTVTGTANRSAAGVDVDSLGYVWVFNPDHNDAFVVDPGPGLFDGQVDETVAGFDTPDVYRDVTGHRIRYPVDDRGLVREIFEACDPKFHDHTEWQTLRFSADTDGDSQLHWRVRAADDRDELEQTAWIDIGTTPPTQSPVDLRALLATGGLARARYVEVETELVPSSNHDEFGVPRLELVDVIATCDTG